MSEPRYDVFFRGDIAPGQRLNEVRDRLRQLFGIDDARLNALFSGRPMAIRRDLAGDEAERYRAALREAGALVELRPLRAADVPAAAGPLADAADDWSLAPVGADVLRPDERPAVVPVSVDIGGLEVAPPGVDVLRPEERRPAVVRNIDTQHLGLLPSTD
ncbi:MAG: hypothetical protein AB7I68_04935 [Porticoccaceae bacterium]